VTATPEPRECRNCRAPVTALDTPIPDHCGLCPPWRCEGCGEMDAPPPNSCSCWVPLEGMCLADIKAVFAAVDLSVCLPSCSEES